MEQKPYLFITDPGHGWLQVEYSELVALGIERDISAYSYRRGGLVYLEEDEDAGKFFRAKGWEAWPHELIREVYQHTTPIRNYARYVPTRREAVAC